MTVSVTNQTMYNDNPYHGLLYAALDGRYKAKKGTFDTAISEQHRLPKGERHILHVHWEESLIRNVETSVEARQVAKYFNDRIDYFKKLGGYIVWTVHNILPHELQNTGAFMSIRLKLMEAADKILIHNFQSLVELRQQGNVDLSRIQHLPHASYTGVYGVPELPARASRKSILMFGKVRRYKGIDIFLDKFLESDLPDTGYKVHVCGGLIKNDDYGDQLLEKFSDVDALKLNFTHVLDDEVKDIFLGSSCIVLPYTRFLTSGALMAAMTYGLPCIAPRAPQTLEVLPSAAHEFLYDADDDQGVINALKALNGLSSKRYRGLRSDLLDRADLFHPNIISKSLGEIYDARYSS